MPAFGNKQYDNTRWKWILMKAVFKSTAGKSK